MTGLDRAIQELARYNQPHRLHTKDNNPLVSFQQGLITGVHLGGLDILLRGTSTPVEQVRYLRDYTPGWGDIVWVARFGSDMICLGDLETLPGTGGILNDPVTIEPWHEIGAAGEPGFQNSWVNFGGVHATAAFAMQSDGWVRMKGLVKNGTTLTSTMFNLPADYRPPFLWGGQAISNGANTSITIGSTGNVTNAGAGGSTAYVSLAGITWPTVAAWERERDTSWFHLVRSQNGWTSDDSDINVFPMIYRRADGWRYIKGNIQGGTGGAGTSIVFTDQLSEDAVAYSEMFSARESGVGQARVDLRGPSGVYTRVTGGTPGPLILVGITFWARRGENILSVDPTYPHKSMQVWLNVADTANGGFENGWVNYNTGIGSTAEWRKFQFFKDDFGIVHIRGLVNGASKTSNVICTLPVGYRPLQTHVFPTVCHSAGGGIQGRLDVRSDGVLEAITGVANWHSIWGQFKAEQ